MTKQLFNKILIVGDAGRGKSTLAEKISKKLGIPFYSTDDFLYEVKYTIYKERQKGLDEISKIYHGNKWIVEGTTNYLLKPGIELADIIIHLKHNNIFNQWAIIFKRHFKRKDNSFLKTLDLMRHVLFKRLKIGFTKGQLTTSERIAPHKHKVVELTSFKEIDEFINQL